VKEAITAFLAVGLLAAAFTLGLASPRRTPAPVDTRPPPCEYVRVRGNSIAAQWPEDCAIRLARPDGGTP
jgi:hypothetical protein